MEMVYQVPDAFSAIDGLAWIDSVYMVRGQNAAEAKSRID